MALANESALPSGRRGGSASQPPPNGAVYSARKRTPSTQAGGIGNTLPLTPKAFVSNPFLRANTDKLFRTGTPQRGISVLSRVFERKINPRKFSRRWSRARTVAAIVCIITATFILARKRREKRDRFYAPKSASARNTLSAYAATNRISAGIETVQNGSKRLVHPTTAFQDVSAPQDGTDGLARISGGSDNPNSSEERDHTDFSHDSTGLDNFHDDVRSFIPPGAQRGVREGNVDLPLASESKMEDSLPEDMSEELSKVGEKPMSKSEPLKAPTPKLTKEVHGNDKHNLVHLHQPKGFQASIEQQNLAWDSIHLDANPWQELSGSKGQYFVRQSSSPEPQAVEMWSHRDVHASKDFKFPFCRLYGACRAKSGRILLPKGLEKHKAKLARCGILSDRNFVLGDNDAEAAYTFVQETGGAKLADMDLVERHAPRRGAAHFLADSLKLLFFVDAMHGASATNEGLLQKLCLDFEGTRNSSCIADENPSDVRPVMFVRKESFVDDVWVPHYMKMLASRGTVRDHTPLRFLNQYDLYPNVKEGEPEAAACFRSITTSAYMYGQVPASALTAANPFFPGNKINRESIQPLKGSQADPPNPSSGIRKCRLRVKLSDYLTGESAAHLQDMTKILKTKIGDSRLDNPISLLLILPSKEHVPFTTQVRRVQETDILVAPHGSPLTDIIFLRSGAGVIEVHPFSYLSGMFQGIAHQLSLVHSKVSAEPDVKMFEACLARYNSEPESLGVPELVSKMKSAAEQFETHAGTPLHLEEGSRDFRHVHEIKLCARKQRMRIDASSLADQIWATAQQLCTAARK
jgi:hypothetical protein